MSYDRAAFAAALVRSRTGDNEDLLMRSLVYREACEVACRGRGDRAMLAWVADRVDVDRKSTTEERLRLIEQALSEWNAMEVAG